jgi:CRP/FNR family transcriptional regulator, cyclic AMP receptor protein
MDAGRIAAIPLFSDLPEEDLARLAEVASELGLEDGDTLTTEGEFGHCLFAVETGTADVFADGRAIGAVGPGDVVGEIAVVASGRRTATIVATSPMQLITLFKRDVWELERSTPQVAERLRELLARHLTMDAGGSRGP